MYLRHAPKNSIDWFIKKGYLENVSEEGKNAFKITELGYGYFWKAFIRPDPEDKP